MSPEDAAFVDLHPEHRIFRAIREAAIEMAVEIGRSERIDLGSSSRGKSLRDYLKYYFQPPHQSGL